MTSKNRQEDGAKYRHIVRQTATKTATKRKQKGDKHGHVAGKLRQKSGDNVVRNSGKPANVRPAVEAERRTIPRHVLEVVDCVDIWQAKTINKAVKSIII